MTLPQAVAELLAPRAVPLPLRVGTGGGSAGPALSTGLPALDRLAPGGIPRGRLTELVGRRGAGTTTLLRRVVERTVADGGWVAVIDASRTLSPRDWAAVGETGRVWVVRPEDATRAAWCADVLLRSGTFALVVLDTAPPLSRAIAVRLTRLARETGAALMITGEREGGATPLASALRLRVTRGELRVASCELRVSSRAQRGIWLQQKKLVSLEPDPSHSLGMTSSLAVLVEKGGTHGTVEVSCAIELSRRLCAHPEVPDRRGVAHGASRLGKMSAGRRPTLG